MNTLVILIKLLNILLVINLVYKLSIKKSKTLNTFYFTIVIILSLLISFFSSMLEINIFTFLLLIITLIVISNVSSEENYDNFIILISNGKLNIKEILKNKYSLRKVLFKIKEKGINSFEDVDLAILEKDGSITIFVKYDNFCKNNTLSLIVNGKINYDILRKLNKNSNWLENELEKRKILLKEVIYAFFSNNLLYVIKK